MIQLFGPLFQPIMTLLGMGFPAPPPDIGVAPQSDTIINEPGVPFFVGIISPIGIPTIVPTQH
jgi:hypothetical protein